MTRALFLDRDGVLINYIPYLSQPSLVSLPSGASQALAQWQAAGYQLIIITNQAGIGRGYFSLEDYQAVQQQLESLYRQQGVSFTGTYFCPHAPDIGCNCRKPAPGMLQQAAIKQGITLAESYFIGDAPSDLQAAIAAGCRPVLLLTGRGKETQQKLSTFSQPIPIFANLRDTVALLNASASQ